MRIVQDSFKMTKGRLVVDIVLLAFILVLLATVESVIWMPGEMYSGSFLPLSSSERETEIQLRKHIQVLAGQIGERNSSESLNRSVAYIKGAMASNGYSVEEHEFTVDKQKYKNLVCTLSGKSDEILLVAAHYDTVGGCAGADDNGSGVASVIETARLVAGKHLDKTVRFVFFCNEEPPFFSSQEMGSYYYEEECKRRGDKIVGLLVLETLGYYTDAPNSQQYPSNFVPGYPTQGNFVTFVGNQYSRQLTEKCVGEFRRLCKFPSIGVAAPNWVNGVDWSDQYWFWKNGIPALMVTDTAPYRYPYYHSPKDTADKLSYSAFSRVVVGLSKVIESIAG
jgi:hypothetical protein